jgi:tetratricopeptide (TPR) repeat protein
VSRFSSWQVERLCVLPLVILSLAAASLVAQQSTAVAEAPSCLPAFTDAEYARFDPSIRQQILGARQRAERTPTAETVGELGILLHAYDQYDRAAACYQRARQLAPSAFQWSYYLAIARADAGEPEAAITALRQALQLTPGDLPARLRLAELLLGRGDLGESRRMYDDLVREHPDSGLAQYGLGRTQAEQGEVAAAVESYRRAIDRVPQFGAAHYALALLYTKLGQRARSAEHLAAWQANRERRPRAQDP